MLEKGFVFGASYDGIVYHREEKNEYGLEIDQKSLLWLKIVQKYLQKAYRKNSKIRKTKRGYFRLNVYSKDLYNELKKLHENPHLILEQNEKFQIGFLQGIFDAQGSIRFERRHITVSSNEPKTAEIVIRLLEKNCIKTGKPFKDKNNVISIPFYGKNNMLKFSRIINFRHPEKKERLDLLLKSLVNPL